MEGGELFHQMYVGSNLLPFGIYKAPAGAADKVDLTRLTV